MQLNKCIRCGCFFMTNDSICPKCKPKDMYDMNKLRTFLGECSSVSSIEEISSETGITTQNLHRYFASNEIFDFNNPTKFDL